MNIESGGRLFRVRLEPLGGTRFRARVDGEELQIRAQRTPAGSWLILLDGKNFEVYVGAAHCLVEGEEIRVRRAETEAVGLRRRTAAAEGPIPVVSPMPGRGVEVLVQEGQEVAEGEGLIVVEAMKMENEITAPQGGRILSVNTKVGEAVDAGAPLLTLESG